MKILSLDCSTKSTGYAIYEDNKLIDYGCITSTSTDLFKRIHKMVDTIQSLMQKHTIDKIIAEEVRPDEGIMNIKTHKALMFLEGAVAMMVHDNYPKIEMVYLYPSEWRKCCGIKTGRGVVRSSVKQKDIEFVKTTFNIEVNDDIADAIGIGYAYLHPAGKEEIIYWGK